MGQCSLLPHNSFKAWRSDQGGPLLLIMDAANANAHIRRIACIYIYCTDEGHISARIQPSTCRPRQVAGWGTEGVARMGQMFSLSIIIFFVHDAASMSLFPYLYLYIYIHVYSKYQCCSRLAFLPVGQTRPDHILTSGLEQKDPKRLRMHEPLPGGQSCQSLAQRVLWKTQGRTHHSKS